MSRCVRCFVVVVYLALSANVASTVRADETPAAGTDDRSQAFRAVQGASGDGASGELLLVASYAVAWGLVFAYMLTLGRRLRTLESQLEDVQRAKSPGA